MKFFEQHSTQLGTFALYIVCFGAFFSPPVAALGSALLLLAVPISLTAPARMLAGPLPWVLAGFFCLLIVRTLTVDLFGDGTLQADWKYLANWLQLALLIPFALFLRADPQQLGRLLLLALCGLVLGVLRRLDWERAFNDPIWLLTDRHGYGFTAIGFALLCGTTVIGLLCLRRRWWENVEKRGWNFAGRLLWFVLLILMMHGFLQSRSRGSLLALICAALVGLIGYGRLNPRPPAGKQLSKTLTIIGLVIVAVAALNGASFIERWSIGYESVTSMLRGDLERVSKSSEGLRWQAHVAGLEFWRQKPWFGWGPVETHRLMATDDLHLKHLHNTYLEILVQFGLVGLLLFVASVSLLLYQLWQVIARNRIPVDYGLFLFLSAIYGLLWSLFNFRIPNVDWRMYWIIIFGASLSWVLLNRRGVDKNL